MPAPGRDSIPSLSRALAAPRNVLSTLEVAATLWALLLAFGFGPTFHTIVAVSVAPLVVLVLGQYVFDNRRQVRPIELLVSQGLNGTLAAADRTRLGELLVTFPRRVIYVRFGAWAVTAATLVVGSAILTGVEGADLLAIAGSCAAVALVFLMWRAHWFRQAAETALLPALPGADAGRYLGRTVRERLFVAAYLPIAGGAVLAGIYDWLFMGIHAEGLRSVFVIFMPVALFVLLTFARALFGWTAPLRAHLAGRPVTGPGDDVWKLNDPVPDPGPAEALRVATALPYRSAAWALGLWTVCGVFLSLLRGIPAGSWQEGLLLFGGLEAVGAMAALLQLAWSRRVVQPARELCVRELGALPLGERWPQVTLRDRFVAVVAVVLLASTTFAYSTLYLQQRESMSAAAGAEARTALDELWPQLDALPPAPGEARTAALSSLVGRSAEPLVVVQGRSLLAHSASLRLPQKALEELRSGADEVVLQGSRQTVALRSLPDGTRVGVARRWRQFPGAYSVIGISLLFITLGIVALVIALVAAYDVTHPIKSMRIFARQLARGDLDAAAPVPEPDEIGELGVALDRMRSALREQINAVTALNQSLERKVEERTAELQQALADLHAAQAQMLHTEKMASVGRLAAGVAHEINNPLNFIANALGPIATTINDIRAVAALQATGDAAAAQREREARSLGESMEELDDLLRVMRNGVTRTQQIVAGLRDFSRKDEGEHAREVDLMEICDQTTALLRHELTGRITVVRELAPDSRLVGFPGALGQLVMNLMANAAQAISGEGTITFRTRWVGDWLELSVRDTGAGIPPDVLPKIFDPFFTTKDVGKGSGLGLSIAHGIVERHRGRISVESTPGAGTCFTVALPRSAEGIARAG